MNDFKAKMELKQTEKKDYESILQKMTYETETNQKSIAELKQKNILLENKNNELTDELIEKDEKIIDSNQKNIYYEDKIRELQKEIDFQKSLCSLA